jgi:hypothetical protein
MKYNTSQKIETALQKLLQSDEDHLEQKLNSILKQLPTLYSRLIEDTFQYKRVPKEYMLSSVLFAISAATGLTFYINALGYKNYGNCYFAIVGSRGDAKSEAIKTATAPIKNSDDIDYDTYIDDKEEECDNEKTIIRKQILLQNASIEAAQKVHADNPNSIGLCMDEIFSLIEKMSNPNSRDGIPWRNFFLEGYTNGHIDVSRKTTDSFRINETYPTLIGGLQHQFLPKLFANGNLESGFIDRLFFTNQITNNGKLIHGEMNEEILKDYETAIENILSYKRQSEKPKETNKKFEIKTKEAAYDLIFDYTQELINKKSQAPAMIKEYYAKMQISIQKLCVIVFMLRHASKTTFATQLTLADVQLAIEINEFYFLNFKQIVKNNFSQKEKPFNEIVKDTIKIAKKNDATQKAVVEITGLSKSQVSKIWNKQETGN